MNLNTQNILRIQDNYSIRCGFYCVAFIEYMLAGKTLLDYANWFSPNNYKKNDEMTYKYFKYIYMVEEASLEFSLRKIDETRNYLLHEINHNDLMGEKYKKASKYLNHVEHLLILVSTVTGCVSIFAFASSVCFLLVLQVLQ